MKKERYDSRHLRGLFLQLIVSCRPVYRVKKEALEVGLILQLNVPCHVDQCAESRKRLLVTSFVPPFPNLTYEIIISCKVGERNNLRSLICHIRGKKRKMKRQLAQ